MTSIVVNHILNEEDKDDEADIQKVVHRVNTDDERLQKALKENKQWAIYDLIMNPNSKWVNTDNC